MAVLYGKVTNMIREVAMYIYRTVADYTAKEFTGQTHPLGTETQAAI